MPKNVKVQFRVTKNQHQRLHNNAQAKGFQSASSYLRSLALGNDLFTEKTIRETNDNVRKILQILQEKL